MSAVVKSGGRGLADPLDMLKKLRRSLIVQVMAWIFTIHGTIRLGTDFWSMRQPFVLDDLSVWWSWTQARFDDVRSLYRQATS